MMRENEGQRKQSKMETRRQEMKEEKGIRRKGKRK